MERSVQTNFVVRRREAARFLNGDVRIVGLINRTMPGFCQNSLASTMDIVREDGQPVPLYLVLKGGRPASLQRFPRMYNVAEFLLMSHGSVPKAAPH